MKKNIITFICFVFIPFFLSGCFNMQAIQGGMNALDDEWGRINNDVYKTIGSKTYNVSKQDAFSAMNFALTSLGMIIVNQNYESGFIYSKASIPTPLTREEWEAIKKVEEPKMQDFVSSYVGEGTSKIFKLSDRGSNVIVNVLLLERPNDMIDITIRAQIERVEYSAVLAYGLQPPPEAVRYALKKTWDSFERELFVLLGAKKK
jgi:hypothetical protein